MGPLRLDTIWLEENLTARQRENLMRHRDFGLLACDEHRATPGFTLFSPLHGKSTYLVGMRGEIVHQWEHPITTGTYGYLLDTGNLLWAGRLPEGPQQMGGRGGLLREYD